MRGLELVTLGFKNGFHNSFFFFFVCLFLQPPVNLLDRADVELSVVAANHPATLAKKKLPA